MFFDGVFLSIYSRLDKSKDELRMKTFPSLVCFSNNQKYVLRLSFQDVKYSPTQYIVPGSKLWGIPTLCYDLNLGMIFYEPRLFRLGSSFGRYPTHTHPQPHTHNHSFPEKILVLIKNHPLTLVHNS